MPLDPSQRVFTWYDDLNHKAAVARELAVRESVARLLPLVRLLIDQSEHRVFKGIRSMLDPDELYQRLEIIEHKLDLVIQAIHSEKDPAEALSKLETQPISPRELGDIDQLFQTFYQNGFSQLNQVMSHMCDMQEELQLLQDDHRRLRELCRSHVQKHADDEDAADWWKRGDEPSC